MNTITDHAPIPVRAPRLGMPRLRDVRVLDPRTKRDLLGRRVARELLRHLARVSVLVVLDAAAAVAAFGVAAALLPGRPVAGGAALDPVPLFVILVLMGQACLRTYAPGRLRRDPERGAIGMALTAAALLLLDAAHAQWTLHTVPAAVTLASAMVLMGVGRTAVTVGMRAANRRGVGCKRTLVIGSRDDLDSIHGRLDPARQPDVAIVGFVSPEGAAEPGALGGVGEIAEIIERHNVNNVVMSAHLPQEELREVVRDCFLHGAAISIVPATLGSIPCRLAGGEILGWPLITLSVPRLHLMQMVVKRMTDVVVSLTAILLLLPVYVAVAVAIKVVMPGPVVFRQMRTGLGGRRFGMLKFRTMRPDAEQVLRDNPELYRKFLENDCKLPEADDPRVTPVGRFLRKTSLDEIPQLFNVLAGHMSLVGPRPLVGPELANYGDDSPVLLGVKPGITGYWQISGRSTVGFPQRAELDLHYISNWSLWMDIRILLLTLPAVIRRKGAH